MNHRLSLKEQTRHMGELRDVPVSIEAKSSSWFRSIENADWHYTEGSVKFNVVGSKDVIEVYWYNRHGGKIDCLNLPAGYTCDVAFDYNREFITFTIDKKQ